MPNRFSGPFLVGRAWHEDGTPFTLQDYHDFSAPPYPTEEQIARWEEAAAADPELSPGPERT